MTSAAGREVRELLESGGLELPRPGQGRTPQRLGGLCEIARRRPVSVARLAEAHTDATAILAEAGREPKPDALYGVWGSQHPDQQVVYDLDCGRIDGVMAFASGLRLVDRALVTAGSSDGTMLIDVDVSAPDTTTIEFDTDSWSSPALLDASTGTVTFTAHEIDAGDVVASNGWYLDRVGFWQGACAPAACWAGAAMGLVDAASALLDDNPHRRAHHGALLAATWTMSSLLAAAGEQIDARPESAVLAEHVARSLRFTIASVSRDVLDRFSRAFGPRPHVEHRGIAQRAIDLDMYIRQHHGERELAAISALVGDIDA